MSISYLFTKQNPLGNIDVNGNPPSNLEKNINNHFDFHYNLEKEGCHTGAGWGLLRHYNKLYPRGKTYNKLVNIQLDSEIKKEK